MFIKGIKELNKKNNIKISLQKNILALVYSLNMNFRLGFTICFNLVFYRKKKQSTSRRFWCKPW